MSKESAYSSNLTIVTERQVTTCNCCTVITTVETDDNFMELHKTLISVALLKLDRSVTRTVGLACYKQL